MSFTLVQEDTLKGKIKEMLIGDELYIERHALTQDSSEKRKYRKLFFKHKSTNQNTIVINTYVDNEAETILGYIHVSPEGTERLLKFNVVDDTISYRAPKGKKMKVRVLGCDTASFLINNLTFSTGADGEYGTIYEHPTQKEFVILIGISTDMMRENDFHHNLSFAIKEGIK